MKSENKVETKKENIKPKNQQTFGGVDGTAPCVITFILQIVFVVCLFGLGLAPILSAFIGVILFLFAGAGVVITTVISAGLLWVNEGFRGFWSKTFEVIINLLNSPDMIKQALSDKFVWIGVILLVASFSGFIVNLIFFIKDRDNTVKFVISCILVALAILFYVLGIFMYR